jgi:dolichol kinase
MFVLEGKRWWSRPVLLAYWGLLAVISVAGWSRQLVRARRHRRYDPPSQPSRAERNAQIGSTVPAGDQPTAVVTGQGNASGFAQMMDAADQRLPTFSVNARRKFFHALAVVMFVPGLAVDVSYYTMTKLTT